MTNQELIDAIAKIINPELFQLPPQDHTQAYHRFVEGEKAKARAIIGLIERELAISSPPLDY